jgi:hypothetical protein
MLTYNEKSLQNLLCEGNAKNVNFQPFQTENFSLKKHHFWNFSSPASKKFFLANSNMPFHYQQNYLQNSEKFFPLVRYLKN